MPRHPPCALKNLTTKDQSEIFERTTKTNHTQQQPPTKGSHHHAQPDPGSYSWKLLLIKDARVHYVVLKQQPRTTHPTHPTRKRGRYMCARCSQETRNTSPTPRPHPEGWTAGHGPVVSGPNSVPNTKPRNPHPAPFQDHSQESNPYWAQKKNTRPLFADIPPVSTRRRTCVCATGVLLTTPTHPHTRGTVVVGAP